MESAEKYLPMSARPYPFFASFSSNISDSPPDSMDERTSSSSRADRWMLVIDD